jgi:hypothetical protein
MPDFQVNHELYYEFLFRFKSEAKNAKKKLCKHKIFLMAVYMIFKNGKRFNFFIKIKILPRIKR